MDAAFAQQFADAWQESWNFRDIDKIIGHYADAVILISPIAGRLLGNAEVKGLNAVKSYFMKGLEAYPDLKWSMCCSESKVLFSIISIKMVSRPVSLCNWMMRGKS